MAIIAAAIIGGAAGIYGGMQANKASAKQSAQQMDFQERMSNEAHQREVKDLRAAGLNPILSGVGGRGAATPPGAQAPQRNVMEGVPSTAMSAVMQKQELKNMRTQRDTIEAQGWQAASTSDAQNAIAHNQAMQGDINEELHTQAMMNTKVMNARQRGDMDAGHFWSSDLYGKKRRLDAAAESLRIVIPFTQPGHSAYGHRKRK